MNELKWKRYFPKDNWEGAVQFLNELSWNLSWEHSNENWWLRAGDQVLFRADSEEEMGAFLLGMAISLAVLPKEIIEEIKQVVAD